MQYREDKYGNPLSVLGFGCLRFPQKAGKIDLEETEEAYCAAFRNDGISPQGKITEGGGLGSLRKKVEREGGTMAITSSPDFTLSVLLPKKGGEIL